MKNVFSILLLLAFNISILHSQEATSNQQQNKWYLQLKIGYGASFNSTPLESPLPFFDFQNATFQGDNRNAKVAYGTLGDGFKAEFQIGYYLSNHVAVELGARYNRTSTISLADVTTSTFIGTHDVKSKWWDINPGVVLSTGFDKKLTGYSRVALSFPILGVSTSNVRINDMEGRIATYYLPIYEKQLGIPLTEDFSRAVETNLEVEAETNGGFSVGLIAGLGFMYQLSPSLNLMVEASVQSLGILADDTSYTSFTQNSTLGGSPLDIEVSTYIQQITYVDDLDENSNNHFFNSEFDIDEPQEELSFKPDYTNVSLMIGVGYSF